jgi:hypothetical protein
MLRPRGPYNRHHRLYPWRRSRCQQYNCLISQIASRDGREKRRSVNTRTQAAHEPFAPKVSSVFLHASYIEVSSQVNCLPRVSVCAASMVALTQSGRLLHRSGRSSLSSSPLGWHTTAPADPSSDPVRARVVSSVAIAIFWRSAVGTGSAGAALVSFCGDGRRSAPWPVTKGGWLGSNWLVERATGAKTSDPGASPCGRRPQAPGSSGAAMASFRKIESSPQIASELPPPRRPDQILALGALANARPNVLHRQDDGPSAMIGELAHGRGLQWQRLLVVGGDAGIEADALIYTSLHLA